MRNALLAALTTLSLPAAAQNLLVVPGAESATSAAWIIGNAPTDGSCNVTVDWRRPTTISATSRNGGSLFFPGCDLATGGVYTLYQDVDVSSNATAVDAGTGVYTFDGFHSGRNVLNPDNVGFALEFYDGSSAQLGTTVDIQVNGGTFGTNAVGNDGLQTSWAYVQQTVTVPVNTRAIRVILSAAHNSGTDIDAFFDDLGLTEGAVALGLGLTRFDAATTPTGAVSLVWEDSRADENAGYDAQWSTDGKSWKTVSHVVTTRGTSNSSSYLHRNPAHGTNYYRVAAIGRDGSLEYGATKVVNIAGNATAAPATVWPVPTKNTVTIGGLHAGLSGTTATLLDAQGRTVRTIILGADAQVRLSLEGCVPGLYSLRLADGQVLRVVKN